MIKDNVIKNLLKPQKA
ncbi:hypothetical protein [Microcoleus sp. S13_C5]